MFFPSHSLCFSHLF